MCWQAIGFALLFHAFWTGVVLGNAVHLDVTVTLIALLYWADSLAGFAVFLVFVLYQNLAISIVSDGSVRNLSCIARKPEFAITLALARVSACRLCRPSATGRSCLLGIAAS